MRGAGCAAAADTGAAEQGGEGEGVGVVQRGVHDHQEVQQLPVVMDDVLELQYYIFGNKNSGFVKRPFAANVIASACGSRFEELIETAFRRNKNIIFNHEKSSFRRDKSGKLGAARLARPLDDGEPRRRSQRDLQQQHRPLGPAVREVETETPPLSWRQVARGGGGRMANRLLVGDKGPCGAKREILLELSGRIIQPVDPTVKRGLLRAAGPVARQLRDGLQRRLLLERALRGGGGGRRSRLGRRRDAAGQDGPDGPEGGRAEEEEAGAGGGCGGADRAKEAELAPAFVSRQHFAQRSSAFDPRKPELPTLVTPGNTWQQWSQQFWQHWSQGVEAAEARAGDLAARFNLQGSEGPPTVSRRI
ncbi:unnamed protein product [Sphagnum tenellum]